MIELEDRLTRYEDLTEESTTFDVQKAVPIQNLLYPIMLSYMLCLALFIGIDCLAHGASEGPLCAVHSTNIEVATIACILAYIIVCSGALFVCDLRPLQLSFVLCFSVVFDYGVVSVTASVQKGFGLLSVWTLFLWLLFTAFSIHREVRRRLFTRGKRTKLSWALKICTLLYFCFGLSFSVMLFLEPIYMYLPLACLLLTVAIYILCLVAYIRKVSLLIFNRK